MDQIVCGIHQLCGTSLCYGPDSLLYTTNCVARLCYSQIVCYTRLAVWHVSLLWTRQFVIHDQLCGTSLCLWTIQFVIHDYLCGTSLCHCPDSLWYETSCVARLSVMDQIVCYTRLTVWHVSVMDQIVCYTRLAVWHVSLYGPDSLLNPNCVARALCYGPDSLLYTTSCVARLSVMDQIVCGTDQLCGTSLCYGPDSLLYTTSCVARLSVMDQIVCYTRLAVWHVSLLWTRQFVIHDQSVWHVSLSWTRQFVIHDQLCGTSLCYGPDSLLYTTSCVARLSVMDQIVCYTRLAVWHVSLSMDQIVCGTDQLCGTSLCYGPDSLL